eukprot:2275573-Prymnesium_polylepis.1
MPFLQNEHARSRPSPDLHTTVLGHAVRSQARARSRSRRPVRLRFVRSEADLCGAAAGVSKFWPAGVAGGAAADEACTTANFSIATNAGFAADPIALFTPA